MLSSKDQLEIQKLCDENNEFKHILELYEENNKLMLSHFTHEIRNPLTLIYSTLQLLGKKYPELNSNSYWGQVSSDMKDVFQLLDQLSTYNHSDTLHKTPVNLLELLTDLKISIEPFAKEKHIPITIKVSKDCHPYLSSYLADQVKLKEAFLNLMKNAVEAVEENGWIKVVFCLRKNDCSYLCISIQNSGTPIPEHLLSTIFTPFITTKSTGTGMGLPISNKIIQSHDGYIVASSNSDKTCFDVYLPIEEL